MEGSFLASSFHPPAADDSVDADPHRYPSWVLLDKRAYFAHRVNSTTKSVKTSTGHDVEITFSLVDPPAVSYFCVHSPEICPEDYTVEPRVVSAAADLVLLCFAFRTGPRSTDVDSDLVEFFVCKAGSSGNLSIEPVPCSPTGTRHTWHASIVPLEGGKFLVADLSPSGSLGHYDLHVFSSETRKWTTTPLQLPVPADVLTRDMPSLVHKVISLGGSMVGWVDLWRGILFCDVLEKEPVLGFIALPKAVFDLQRTGQPQEVRDVTFTHGFINFVEIEHFRRELNIVNRRSFKTTWDLDTEDVIRDKEFLLHDDLDLLDNEPVFVPDGWKIRTMVKRIGWDYWKKKHTVHVDDISADPGHTAMLPQLSKGSARQSMLRNLRTTGFPFFSAYSGNVVYLMSKVESDAKDSWIVGVDLEKKKLEVIKPYCSARASSCDPTVLSCAFSEYLNTTPRLYDELVAANCPQDAVLNNHIRSADTIPVASCAQNGVPNGHLSSGCSVPNNVQPQQNTWNVNSYYGSWNQPGYPGYGNYQQPTPLQPQFEPSPNLSPTMQTMLSSTRSGYINPDVHRRMLMTVSLNDMKMLAAPPFAPSVLPMPAHLLWGVVPGQTSAPLMTSTAPSTLPVPALSPWGVAPSRTSAPQMTSTAGSYAVLGHGQQQPFPSWTQGEEVNYYGGVCHTL